MKDLNELEIKILTQLHLQGFWGNSGNLNKKQRLKYLENLIDKGYLNQYGQPTKKTIETLRELNN
jgi:hypothetical protein